MTQKSKLIIQSMSRSLDSSQTEAFYGSGFWRIVFSAKIAKIINGIVTGWMESITEHTF